MWTVIRAHPLLCAVVDSARRPAHGAATEQVEVKMEDALPRFRPDIAHDPVAAQPKLPCNLPQRAEEGRQQVAIGIG